MQYTAIPLKNQSGFLSNWNSMAGARGEKRGRNRGGAVDEKPCKHQAKLQQSFSIRVRAEHLG